MEYAEARSKFFVSLAKEQGSWLARCEVCRRRAATDVHHIRGREGDLLVNPAFFLGVCRRCHDRIEHAPQWAASQGYTMTRNRIPEEEPCPEVGRTSSG